MGAMAVGHPEPWSILGPHATAEPCRTLTCHVEGEEGACQRCPEEQPSDQDHDEVHSQRHTEAQGHCQHQGHHEGGTAAKPVGDGQ